MEEGSRLLIVETTHPHLPSHPSLESDARWYRFALFLTGNASAAGEIVKALFAVAPEELAQLRSKERRKIWLVRQIRSRAVKWQRENAAPLEAAEPGSFIDRVAALPEPARSTFVFFHLADCHLDDAAHLLKLDRPAFAATLAQARQALAPETAFPENYLLRMHRPWGGDHSKVVKAVRNAQGSPELAAQIAADSQWHEAVEAVAIPEELALLNWNEPPKPGLRAMIFQPAVLAIALALIVVIGVIIYFAETRMEDFSGKETVIAFLEAETAANAPEFESIAPTNAGKLDDWFVLKGFEGYAVPVSLEKAKAIACRVRQHEGVSVAEVELEQSNARLLIFRADDLKPQIAPGEHIFQQDEWAVAVLSDEKNSCVVMFRGDSENMPEFLKTMGK